MPSNSDVIVNSVRASLRSAGLDPTDRLVVGLSGGVDSQVLSHALAVLHDRGEAPGLLLVHVDHQLRPSSNEEARTVEQFARALHLSLDIRRVDVRSWSENVGNGIESSARAARYAALASAARGWSTDWVAVAHNLEDQVETVLLRLGRGASTDGLAGMRELSNRVIPLDPTLLASQSIRLLRPLLRVRSSQIDAYANAQGLVPIVDESNFDTRFRRNAIRHELVPLLERIMPGASLAIARNADLLAGDVDYLSGLAEDGFRTCCQLSGHSIRLERAPFRALPPPVQRRIILHAVRAVDHDRELTRERVEALHAAILGGAVSKIIEVGGGISAVIDYQTVIFGSAENIESELRLRCDLPEMPPGFDQLIRGSMLMPAGTHWQIAISAAESLFDWSVRTRRPGDWVQLSAGPRQKLQDWLVNQKVQSRARDSLPLLVQAGVIRWVAGISAPTFEDVHSGLTAQLVARRGDERLDGEQASGDPTTFASGTRPG